jgi:hypothetical protein
MTTRVEQIQALADGTKTPDQIADALGIKRNYCYAIISEARSRGIYIAAAKPAPERSKTPWADVAALADGTRTGPQIAEEMGISLKRVRRAVKYARSAHGFDARLKNTPPHVTPRNTNDSVRSGGGVHALVARLTPDCRDWLLQQMPAGTTLSEIIAAIVEDAYHDTTDV